MYDFYTMKIVFITNESYEFCNLCLMKFIKIVIYDFGNDNRILKNIFMTNIL